MWLLARGTLSANVKRVHQSYYLPSMTAIATLIYENQAEPMPAKVAEAHRARDKEQLADREAGGHLSLRPRPQREVLLLRINSVLHDLVIPEHRQAFLADPEALFEKFGLTDQERDLIRRRDWRGLIRYGAIFFMLEKLAAVVGVPNPAVYAAFCMAAGGPEDPQHPGGLPVGGNEAQGKIEAGESSASWRSSRRSR